MDEIDPQVKNLVSAIGQAETGDSSEQAYSKPGPSGEYGRYQFMPNTWKLWAGEILHNPNAPMSIENQNRIAYAKVKEWKDAGLNPAQIASKWNSGDPEAYNGTFTTGKMAGKPSIGKNDMGVAYDVPSYAMKVSNNYNQLKNSQGNSIDTSTKDSTQADHGFFGNLAADAIKPFARLGTNLVQAGEATVGHPLTTPFSGSFLGQVNPVGMGIDISKSPLDPQNRLAIADAIKNGVDIGSWFGGGDAAYEDIAKMGFNGFLKKASWNAAKLGATTGFLQGGSTAFNPDATLANTAISTVKDTVLGAGAGAILGPLGALGGRSLGWLTGHGDQKAEQEATQAITEMVSPKVTTKEAKIATTEGRFVPGEKPSVFKGEKPSVIIPSKDTKASVKTIQEYIPEAEKLNPSDLYTKVRETIGTIANKLKGTLQDIPVNRATITKLNEDWATARASQLKGIPKSLWGDVEQRQSEFEEEFLQNAKTWSMDDLWQAAQKYDKSIPERVKQATILSPESLQVQRQEWIANRSIFKNAINDSNNGAGAISDKAFSDMTSLYNAQDGILSNVSGNRQLMPSKAVQFYQKHPIASHVVGTAATMAGLGSLYEGGRKAIEFLSPQ